MDEAGLSNFSDHYYVDDDDRAAYKFYYECKLATIPAHPEFRAADELVRWLYPALVTLGVLGNGVSVFILGQLSVSAWSSCFHLAVLALVDVLILTIRCGSTWTHLVTGVNPSMNIMEWSEAMCKCYLFVLNVLLQLWPWLMVAVSVDLAISTSRPLLTPTACTQERARVTVLLITILLVCLNLNFFWTWGLRHGLCIYTEEFSKEFLDLIWPSIETTVKHVLPLLVVYVCIVVTVVSLIRSRMNGVTYEPILRRYFLDLQALQELKKVHLVLAVMFVGVKTFTFTVEMVNALELRGMIVVPCHKYAHFKASFILAQTLRDVSVYGFQSLKFLVYLVLCQRYRRRFLALVRKCVCCGKGQLENRAPRPENTCDMEDGQ